MSAVSPSIPTSNAFATLAKFQIFCNEGFKLQPHIPFPSLGDNIEPDENEDDIDEAFMQALGVIHQNP